MVRRVLGWLCLLFLPVGGSWARTYTEAEARAAWQRMKRQPITEANFRAACDLLQDIGKTQLPISYEILAEYVPRVQATGNRDWVHILLMGWARAKSSMDFSAEGEKLFQRALANAGPNTRRHREALVATALMYGEWEKDSLFKRYLQLGEQECLRADDRENLSFIYTFKAMAQIRDTAAMRVGLERAIRLAAPLHDKNALFTARYNYANIYLQSNPQKQVREFESLLELAKAPSLNRYPRKLYERTAFTFRNAGPSVYYQLMQLNLVLTDYENAGKFAQPFYDATVKPNPAGVQASWFNAEMAITKVYQGDLRAAREYLSRSLKAFNVPEEKIPYVGYHIAAGLLAEQAGRYEQARKHYQTGLRHGNTVGLHLLPPQLYYAHSLLLTGRIAEADQALAQYRSFADARKYAAAGYYFYKYYADLLKAKGDYEGYSAALGVHYAIKDSLTSLNQYRAIQSVFAKVQLRDKEQQILRLNEESTARTAQIRRERLFYTFLIGLAALTILFLGLYLRNRQIRFRQKEALRQSQFEQLEKQRHIDLMQGVMQAEENERRKIADQLHDEVNALLALATLNISSTLEKEKPDEQGYKKLHKAQEVLSSVSTTIREISHRLTPLALEQYGFRKSIEDLTASVNLAEKLKMETIVVGFEDTSAYTLSFLNDVYRIIQELVHNILKHAQARHATLEIVEHDELVSILVEDDGLGIPDSLTAKGKGLSTIQSKVAYLNGLMEIRRKEEGGTLVVIEITPTRTPSNDALTTDHRG